MWGGKAGDRKANTPRRDLTKTPVCALNGVSPRDRWLCVLPRWLMDVNVTKTSAPCYRCLKKIPIGYRCQVQALNSESRNWGIRAPLQHVLPATKPRDRIALPSCMKTAPEAYHLCAERGASLCKAPSWILLLQSSVSPPTLESAPPTRACLALLFRNPLRPCAPSASSGHRDPTSRHSSLRFRFW